MVKMRCAGVEVAPFGGLYQGGGGYKVRGGFGEPIGVRGGRNGFRDWHDWYNFRDY